MEIYLQKIEQQEKPEKKKEWIDLFASIIAESQDSCPFKSLSNKITEVSYALAL